VRLDYLQMRQQSPSEMALHEGRVMARRQGSRDRYGGNLPRWQADQRRFAAGNPVSCQQT